MIDMNSKVVITLRDYEYMKKIDERFENALKAKEEIRDLIDWICKDGYAVDCKEVVSELSKIESLI